MYLSTHTHAPTFLNNIYILTRSHFPQIVEKYSVWKGSFLRFKTQHAEIFLPKHNDAKARHWEAYHPDPAVCAEAPGKDRQIIRRIYHKRRLYDE